MQNLASSAPAMLPSAMIKRIYNRALQTAAHKHAAWWLAGLAFIGSSFFPVPVDVALMPMCLARRDKSFRYAFICVAGSVLGGLVSYAIGYFLFESVGKHILDLYHLGKDFNLFKHNFNDWGSSIVFVAGFSPVPYEVATMTSGVTHMNLAPFIIASIAGRAVRFYGIAGLIWKYGAPIQVFIEKYLERLTILFFVLLIGVFIGLKYLL